jgi:hypothetical protein
MRRATLNRVSTLRKIHMYLRPYLGTGHCKSHQARTMCSFMMLYYMKCNIQIITPSFCSPSGRVSRSCPQSTCGEIILHVQEHTICDCFCPYDSHSSEDHTLLFQDPPVWWNSQSEIPLWLQQKGLIVWPNIGVHQQKVKLVSENGPHAPILLHILHK